MNAARALACRGALTLLGVASAAHAGQPADPVPTGTYLPRIDQVYLRTDFEVDHERQEAGTPVTGITRQRILVEPAVGLGLSGSIYHPNLLEYKLTTELGLDWQDASVDQDGHHDETHFLQRYHGICDILRERPYTLSLFADKDLVYRDYDFFTRVRVNSERYGARSGYSTGPVPFTVSLQHYEERVDDLARPNELTEDTLALTAQNQRRNGRANTQLNYNLDDYTRRDDGLSAQHGLSQNLSLFDTEAFGPGDWVRLTSLLNYSSLSKTVQPTDKLLIQETLQLQHTKDLRSFYDYAFDHSTSGDSEANTHLGRLGVSHQLYENLTSTLDLHANTTASSSPGNSLDTTRRGLSLSEQYARSLGTWGNLLLSYQGTFDHEDREATGSELNITDEPHALSDGTITFLSQPSVDVSTLHVTDSTGTVVYLEGLDYEIFRRGALIEIRRIPGGRIPEGSVVLADYTAVLDPSASFDSFDHHVAFRLDLWKGLVGFYGRWASLDYAGGENLNLRWLDSKTIGLDSTWRWFRAGAEYETVDSNLAPYDRVRLFESVQFEPIEGSTFGLNLDQSWTTYRADDIRQTIYGAILRYQQRFTPRLSWNLEGGVRIERGETFDRDFGTVRTGLDWVLGKLTVKVGYEYNTESHPTDFRDRHYFFLRIRRDFF